MQKIKRVLAIVLALTIVILQICSIGTVYATGIYIVSYDSEIYTDTGVLIDTLYHDDVFEDYYMNELDTNSYSNGDTATIQQKPFYRYAIEGSYQLHNDVAVETERPDLTFLGYDAYMITTTTGSSIYLGRFQPGDTLKISGASIYLQGIYHKTTTGGGETTYAETGNVCGDYTYNVTTSGKAVITNYSGASNIDVIVPSTLDEYTVTEILTGAFTNLSASTPMLVIPDNVAVHEYAIKNYSPKIIKLGTGIQFPDANPVFGNLGFPRYLENAYSNGGPGYYVSKFNGSNIDWIKLYQISYARNDGTGYIHTDSDYYAAGDTVVLFTPQERVGYDFIGYTATSTYNTGDSLYTDSYTMPANDVMLYTQWVQKTGQTCSVTYTADGADTGCTAPLDNNVYKSGDTVTANNGAGLTKVDYELVCWVDGLGNEIPLGSSFVITASKTLHPKWVKMGYHVTYHASGSTSGSQHDTNTYKNGDTATIKDAGTMQKTGYCLVAWLQKDLQQPYQLDEISIITLSDDGKNLYINNGTLTAVAKNTVITYIPSSNLTITDDITLYPVWQIKPPIFYDANGGLGTAPVDTNTYPGTWDSATVKGPEGLYKPGYEFIGWSKTIDNSSNRLYQMGDTVLASTIKGTLYAQWRQLVVTPPTQTYSVSYNSGIKPKLSNIMPIDTSNYKVSDSVVILAFPNANNYDFIGYSCPELGRMVLPGEVIPMPASNITLTAMFVIKYNILYDKGAYPLNLEMPSEVPSAGVVFAKALTNTSIDVDANRTFNFVNWYCPQLNAYFNLGDIIMIPGIDLTLIAQWQVIIKASPTYKVSYIDNVGRLPLGKLPKDMKDYSKGDTVTVKGLDVATADAYGFKRWIDVLTADKYSNNDTFKIQSEVTLAAEFEQYTISYKNDNQATQSFKLHTDSNKYYKNDVVGIATTSAEIVEGVSTYKFDGWDVTGLYTGTADSSKVKIQGDLIATAKWLKTEAPVVTPELPQEPQQPQEPEQPQHPAEPTPSEPSTPTSTTPIQEPAEPTLVKPSEPTEKPKPVVYGTVHGVVTGPDGKPLEGIRVELHSVVRFTYTDKQGKYSFDNVDLGNHKVILKDPDTLKVLNVETVIVKDIEASQEQEYLVSTDNLEVSKAIELSEGKAEKQIDFVLNGYKKVNIDTKVTPVVDKGGSEPVKDDNGTKNTQPEVQKPTDQVPEQVEPIKGDVISQPTKPTDEVKRSVTPDNPEPVKPETQKDDKPSKPGIPPWLIILIVLLIILLLALLIYIIKSRLSKEPIYALVYDKKGEYVGNAEIVLKTDIAKVDLGEIETELGSLVGVRVEIESETVEKLVGFEVRVIDIAGQVRASKLIKDEDSEQSVIIAIK